MARCPPNCPASSPAMSTAPDRRRRTRDRAHPRRRTAVVESGTPFVLATGRPPRWLARWSTGSGSLPSRCARTARCSTTPPPTGSSVRRPCRWRPSRGWPISSTTNCPGPARGRTHRYQRARHGHRAVRQRAGLRTCLAQPRAHGDGARGSAVRAGREDAHPPAGSEQRRHGRQAASVGGGEGRSHLLDEQRPDRGVGAGGDQGVGTETDGAARRRTPRPHRRVRRHAQRHPDAGDGRSRCRGRERTPEAKAAADEVTATNSDDGVARVLERLWRS